MPYSCRLSLSAYRNIVILTGAGVSAASGIPTFRGEGGLWNDPLNSLLNTKEALEHSPGEVWEFFRQRYQEISAAAPNPAHTALVQWENSLLHSQNFTLITQNIDGLHLKAGSKNVIEYHGSLRHVRCANEACGEPLVRLESGWPGQMMRCTVCDHPLRPNVVFFGEAVAAGNSWRAKASLRDCDLFIAIGTSGTVSPASNFVRSADFAGARTILINATEPEHPNPYFKEVVIGKAEEILPDLVF